jgi:DUF971 family protein
MSQADLHPVSMEKVGTSGLRIIWSDGLSHEISWNLLRAKCPCASCREEKETPPNPLRVLKASELIPLKPVRFSPVGHYAYKIDWSDGHATGIYSLKFLREICVT